MAKNLNSGLRFNFKQKIRNNFSPIGIRFGDINIQTFEKQISCFTESDSGPCKISNLINIKVVQWYQHDGALAHAARVLMKGR